MPGIRCLIRLTESQRFDSSLRNSLVLLHLDHRGRLPRVCPFSLLVPLVLLLLLFPSKPTIYRKPATLIKDVLLEPGTFMNRFLKIADRILIRWFDIVFTPSGKLCNQ